MSGVKPDPYPLSRGEREVWLLSLLDIYHLLCSGTRPSNTTMKIWGADSVVNSSDLGETQHYERARIELASD